MKKIKAAPQGNEYEQRRLRKGLTQRQVAKGTGYTDMTISLLERNCLLGGQCAKAVLEFLVRAEHEEADQ